MRTRSSAGGEKKPDATPIPVDSVNEQVIIAAVCVDRAAAADLLPAYGKDHFFTRSHPRIWEVLQDLHARGLSYDPATVRQLSGGDVDVDYLEALVKDRPAAPPNLRHHVRMLRWDRARVLSAMGPVSLLLAALSDVTAPEQRVIALAREVLQSLAGHGTDGSIRTAHDVAREHAQVLTDRRTGHACYGYGIPGLDLWTEGPERGEPRMVPGASPGTVTLLTGVSGSGKSSLACRIILEWVRLGSRVLVGAWEQGEGVTLELLAVMSLGFSRTDVSRGFYDEAQQQELVAEMERLTEWVSFFVLPFGKARAGRDYNDKALDLVHQVVADSGCDVVVMDLVRRALKETNPDDEEQAAFRLQAIGKELGVHQLWIHQQRGKDVETRPDKRPTRDGLKGSSAWLEACDTCIGCHRDYLWKNVPDDRMELIVLKQRYGRWPIAVEFDWDPEMVTLTNGRTVEYTRPGDDSPMDDFLKGGGKKGWR